MANRKTKKIPFNNICFKSALEYRKQSITGITRDERFIYTSKTIHRALKDRMISYDALNNIAEVLDIDPDYLSGKFIFNLKYEESSESYLYFSPPESHPYINKLQRDKIDNQYIEDKMIEYILITHGLMPEQFEKLDDDHKRNFLLDLEESLVKTILKHFKTDSQGNVLDHEIYRNYHQIECFYDNEPEPPNDFFENMPPSRFKKE